MIDEIENILWVGVVWKPAQCALQNFARFRELFLSEQSEGKKAVGIYVPWSQADGLGKHAFRFFEVCVVKTDFSQFQISEKEVRKLGNLLLSENSVHFCFILRMLFIIQRAFMV